MENNKLAFKSILLTSASFAGYNIGSGFATGVEALQFFGAWGGTFAFSGIALALLTSVGALIAIYVTGFEQHFDKDSEVYHYFCGKYFGIVIDYYIYISMICVALTMMSGAGATISQYSGLPAFAGALLMGGLCIITALLGLERLRKALSYMCIFIILFVLFCGGYVIFTSDIGPFAGSANVGQYVEMGRILRANTFGIQNPYLSGFSSAGLLICSGIAWASATGALCNSKREAVWSGILSSILYYVTTAVVVYLVLTSMDHIAGAEVPMLSVVQFFLPKLSAVYSLIIILAIFSTISGRLFLIAKRYDHGNKKMNIAIIISITILAVAGASFIPFSIISNVVFSIMGAVGIILVIIVLTRFLIAQIQKEETGDSVE